MKSYKNCRRFTDVDDDFSVDEQIKKLERMRDLCEKRIADLKTRQMEVEFDKLLKAMRNLPYP